MSSAEERAIELLIELRAMDSMKAIKHLTKALQERDKSRCPCGGIILADTDDCTTMLCCECAIQIKNVMVEKDTLYNEGFMAGRKSQEREVSD